MTFSRIAKERLMWIVIVAIIIIICNVINFSQEKQILAKDKTINNYELRIKLDSMNMVRTAQELIEADFLFYLKDSVDSAKFEALQAEIDTASPRRLTVISEDIVNELLSFNK